MSQLSWFRHWYYHHRQSQSLIKEAQPGSTFQEGGLSKLRLLRGRRTKQLVNMSTRWKGKKMVCCTIMENGSGRKSSVSVTRTGVYPAQKQIWVTQDVILRPILSLVPSETTPQTPSIEQCGKNFRHRVVLKCLGQVWYLVNRSIRWSTGFTPTQHFFLTGLLASPQARLNLSSRIYQLSNPSW